MESAKVTDSHPLSITYGEYLDELCAYYVSIGVPMQEFWHGDYTYLKNYERAHEYRSEEVNQQMWLQGLYIYRAVGTALANAFGDRNAKYIKEPISILPKTEYQKRLEETEKQNKLIERLNRWAANFNVNNNRQP